MDRKKNSGTVRGFSRLDALLDLALDARPRNNDGQFSPETGGPNPTTMAQAYGMPAKAGAAALGGGTAAALLLRKLRKGK